MNDVVVRNQGVLQSWAPEVEVLLREQFGLQKANDSEISYFFQVCQRTGLDPIAKQIYPVMRYDNRAKREKLVIQIGIDGYRAIAADSGEYAGSDDAVFTGTIEHGNVSVPESASVTVYRMVQGQRVPFTASARWTEYVPGEKQDYQWRRMPHVMLAKVAEALALRKAFPKQLGGTYVDAEMQAPDEPVVVALTPEQETELVAKLVEGGMPEGASRTAAKATPAAAFDRALAKAQRLVDERALIDQADEAEVVGDEAIDFPETTQNKETQS